MRTHRTRVAALTATVLGALALAPVEVAQADVTDDAVLATVGFDQAYLGLAQFDGDGGDDLDDRNRATLGLFGRLELNLIDHFAFGAEGAFRWYRTDGDVVIDDGRGRLADANGFVRILFPLDDRKAEYYLMAGAGASFLLDDDLGQGVAIDGSTGWNVFARAGVRGELVDGFGGILELGWVRRQVDGAFAVTGEGGGVQTFGFVTNQMTVVFGWYVAL